MLLAFATVILMFVAYRTSDASLASGIPAGRKGTKTAKVVLPREPVKEYLKKPERPTRGGNGVWALADIEGKGVAMVAAKYIKVRLSLGSHGMELTRTTSN